MSECSELASVLAVITGVVYRGWSARTSWQSWPRTWKDQLTVMT